MSAQPFKAAGYEFTEEGDRLVFRPGRARRRATGLPLLAAALLLSLGVATLIMTPAGDTAQGYMGVCLGGLVALVLFYGAYDCFIRERFILDRSQEQLLHDRHPWCSLRRLRSVWVECPSETGRAAAQVPCQVGFLFEDLPAQPRPLFGFRSADEARAFAAEISRFLGVSLHQPLPGTDPPLFEPQAPFSHLS